MAGGWREGRHLVGEHARHVDAVVVGSGAGGAMAARTLATRGLRTLVLEEGPEHRPEHSTQREDEMLPRLFRDLGGQRTADLGILVLSGRGLGGSTLHNTNLSRRIADPILTHWADDLGLPELAPGELAPYFDEVERLLHVVPIPEDRVSEANRRVRRGVEALGWRGGVLRHNRDGRCRASGFCELGCAYDGKVNARRELLPAAVAAGAEVWADCEVTRVVVRRARVEGVEAVLRDGRGEAVGALHVRAPLVLLAGSAVGSAALALASKLPDPSGRVGRGLHLHPGAVVAGIFPDRVEAWRGVPQSVDCTEWLDLHPGSTRRVWIVPSFAHPVGAAALMTGFGPAYLDRMRDYPRMIALAAMVHDETEGRVVLDRGRPRLHYAPNEADRAQLALGARAAAEILLAAGAERCVVPAVPPIEVRTRRDLEAIQPDRFRPNDAKLTAVHPMGTLAMGRVCDAWGRWRGCEGLVVVDGSLFPTSIGGPPQLGISAFALRNAARAAGVSP